MLGLLIDLLAMKFMGSSFKSRPELISDLHLNGETFKNDRTPRGFGGLYLEYRASSLSLEIKSWPATQKDGVELSK